MTEKDIYRPHWAQVLEKDFFGQDGDQQLLVVTRESLRLAVSALKQTLALDYYHNSGNALREIESVLEQPKC